MTDMSFFASGNMPYIERARLMVDVDLSGYSIPIMPAGMDWSDFELELNDHGTYSIRKVNSTSANTVKANDIISVPEYIEAPFFIPILAGLYKQELPANRKVSSPNTRGFKGHSLNTKAIESTNYIRLKIPKYILYQYINYSTNGFSMYWSDFEVELTANGYRFKTVTSSNSSSTSSNFSGIKKGTEFLIASVGGQLLVENIRIIGLYTI